MKWVDDIFKNANLGPDYWREFREWLSSMEEYMGEGGHIGNCHCSRCLAEFCAAQRKSNAIAMPPEGPKPQGSGASAPASASGTDRPNDTTEAP